MKNVLYWLHHLLAETHMNHLRHKNILGTLEVHGIPEVAVQQEERADHDQEENISICLKEVEVNQGVVQRIWLLTKNYLVINIRVKDTVPVLFHQEIDKIYSLKYLGAVYIYYKIFNFCV